MPDTIFRQHVVNLVDDLETAMTPLVNVVEQPKRQILTNDIMF